MKKRVDGINSNTYNLLFEDYNNLNEEEQGSYEYTHLQLSIGIQKYKKKRYSRIY